MNSIPTAELDSRRAALRWLLLAVTALLLYGSLYPFQFHSAPPGISALQTLWRNWPASFTQINSGDAVVNVVLYIPLGLLCFLSLPSTWLQPARFMTAVLCCAFFSLTIELIQFYDSSRVCSALDWFCNASGAWLGAVAASRFDISRHPPAAIVASERRAAVPFLLIACWTLSQFLPLLLHIRDLAPAHHHVLRPQITVLQATELFESFVMWLMAARIWEGAFGPRTALRALLVIQFALPLRLLFLGGSTLAWAGAIAAILVWSSTWDTDRKRVRDILWLSLTLIVIREFAPFHFQPQPTAFEWVPFAATLVGDRGSALLVMLTKMFIYGGAVWLRSLGNNPMVAGLLTAGLLAILEALQMYMPGRVPEITDSLIALVFGALIFFQERRAVEAIAAAQA